MDATLKARLSAYYLRHPEGFTIDDTTWADLNMDEVFGKIDLTSSSLGDEILYLLLRKPLLSIKELDDMESTLSLYKGAPDKLDKSRKALKSLSKLKKVSVFEYLYYLDRVEDISPFKLFLPLILILLGIGAFFISVPVGVILTVIFYAYNTQRYFVISNKIKPYLVCFSYLSRAIRLGKDIPLSGDEYKALMPLVRGSFILGAMSGESANGGGGNPLDLVLDLLKMGLHFDIIKFYSMLKFVREHFNEIEGYLVKIGKIDAYISILDLRDKLAVYSVPTFTDKKLINIDNMYHILIDKPVPNSIKTDKSILLTGSNASGKSTFLRSVAINAILAQSIHTCLADKYEGAIFKVISSMSIRDNILSGESYYMAEIKAVNRIITLLDENDDNSFILCFTDEILSGTNTKERIAAGSRILSYLNEKGALSFAATHDIELTEILKDEYVNYHFKEDINENDISFSYKLLEGKATSKNAIKLLRLMGFPEDITNRAERLADTL